MATVAAGVGEGMPDITGGITSPKPVVTIVTESPAKTGFDPFTG
jgi:hypothetical protein